MASAAWPLPHATPKFAMAEPVTAAVAESMPNTILRLRENTANSAAVSIAAYRPYSAGTPATSA